MEGCLGKVPGPDFEDSNLGAHKHYVKEQKPIRWSEAGVGARGLSWPGSLMRSSWKGGGESRRGRGGEEGGGSFISCSMFSGPTFFNLCWINNMGLCTQRSSNYPLRLCFLRGNELGMAFVVDHRNAPAQ